MKVYVVRQNYDHEGFSILKIYSDKENAKLDVSILTGLKKSYDSCHYENPHREVMANRIDALGANQYCNSWDFIEMEVK